MPQPPHIIDPRGTSGCFGGGASATGARTCPAVSISQSLSLTTELQVPIAALTEQRDESRSTGILYWQNMKLQKIPTEVSIPSGIRTVKLGNNQLVKFPEEVLVLNEMTRLELNANMISAIPPSITRIRQLQTLHLHFNHLNALPPEMGEMLALTSLHVNGNRLHEIPLELSLCTNLTELMIGENPLRMPFVDIDELPLANVLKAMDQLRLCHETKELHMVNNMVNLLRNDVIEQAHRLSTVLTSLHITHINVREDNLVDLIGNFKLMRSLVLTSSLVHSISGEIGRLSGLAVLDLRENSLQTLPEGFSGLVGLKTLLLDDNALEIFPRSVLGCTSLTHLSLRRNGLEDIPFGFGVLSLLRLLALSANKLVDLPVDLARFDALEMLEVARLSNFYPARVLLRWLRLLHRLDRLLPVVPDCHSAARK